MPFSIAKESAAAVLAGTVGLSPVPGNIQSVVPVETVTYESVAEESCVTEVYLHKRFGFRTEYEYVPRCTTHTVQQPVHRVVYRVTYLDQGLVRTVELERDPRL